MLEEMKITV